MVAGRCGINWQLAGRNDVRYTLQLNQQLNLQLKLKLIMKRILKLKFYKVHALQHNPAIERVFE